MSIFIDPPIRDPHTGGFVPRSDMREAIMPLAMREYIRPPVPCTTIKVIRVVQLDPRRWQCTVAHVSGNMEFRANSLSSELWVAQDGTRLNPREVAAVRKHYEDERQKERDMRERDALWGTGS